MVDAKMSSWFGDSAESNGGGRSVAFYTAAFYYNNLT